MKIHHIAPPIELPPRYISVSFLLGDFFPVFSLPVEEGTNWASVTPELIDAVEEEPPHAKAICWSSSSAPDQVWCFRSGTPVRRSSR
mmetsp:Transcript_37872/g.66620  ORF Transcript_37872/g.66620 Transcript_37872/m.66620 type:complete len:87 (+) Transcript_37872:517-777(+)